MNGGQDDGDGDGDGEGEIDDDAGDVEADGEGEGEVDEESLMWDAQVSVGNCNGEWVGMGEGMRHGPNKMQGRWSYSKAEWYIVRIHR